MSPRCVPELPGPTACAIVSLAVVVAACAESSSPPDGGPVADAACAHDAAADDAGTCAPGYRPCFGEWSGGCSCHDTCRPLLHDCAAGLECRMLDGRGYACQPVDSLGTGGREGSSCGECHEGLVCLSRPFEGPLCRRVECGLVEGAPECGAGQACELAAPDGRLGVCGAACTRFDSAAPCARGAVCLASLSPTSLDGVCVPFATTALPGPGLPCDGLCRVGATCVDGYCALACDPLGRAGANRCGGGWDCVPRDGGEGACEQPCDAFDLGASPCGDGTFCTPDVDACGSTAAHCLASRERLPGLGEPCWGRCDAGLACSGGALPRCVRACLPAAPAGARGACADSERCFAIPSSDGGPALPYGGCRTPCVPGETDCGAGSWCEPLELDAALGRWIGTCV